MAQPPNARGIPVPFDAHSNELPAFGALPQSLVSELVSTVRFSARMLLPVPVAVPLSALPQQRPIFGGDWPVHAMMGPMGLPMMQPTPPVGLGWPAGLRMMGISSELIFLTMHMIPEEMPRPRRPDSQVAEIGTTWTHAGAEVSGQSPPSALTGSMFPDSVARELALASAAEVAWLQVETCGICFEPFEPGNSLTSMPCAREGCKSVWHTDCIREWLARSRALSCPLCRTVAHVAGDIGSSDAVGGGLGDLIWMEEPLIFPDPPMRRLRTRSPPPVSELTREWFRNELGLPMRRARTRSPPPVSELTREWFRNEFGYTPHVEARGHSGDAAGHSARRHSSARRRSWDGGSGGSWAADQVAARFSPQLSDAELEHQRMVDTQLVGEAQQHQRLLRLGQQNLELGALRVQLLATPQPQQLVGEARQQQLLLRLRQQNLELVALRDEMLATPGPAALPAHGGPMPATRLAHPGQAPPRQAPPRQVPPRQAPPYIGASGTGAGLISTRPNFVRLVQWSPGASAWTAAGQPPQGAHPFGARALDRDTYLAAAAAAAAAVEQPARRPVVVSASRPRPPGMPRVVVVPSARFHAVPLGSPPAFHHREAR